MIIDPVKRGHSPTRNEQPVGDLEGRPVSRAFASEIPSSIKPKGNSSRTDIRSLKGRCVLRFPQPSRSKGP